MSEQPERTLPERVDSVRQAINADMVLHKVTPTRGLRLAVLLQEDVAKWVEDLDGIRDDVGVLKRANGRLIQDRDKQQERAEALEDEKASLRRQLAEAQPQAPEPGAEGEATAAKGCLCPVDSDNSVSRCPEGGLCYEYRWHRKAHEKAASCWLSASKSGPGQPVEGEPTAAERLVAEVRIIPEGPGVYPHMTLGQLRDMRDLAERALADQKILRDERDTAAEGAECDFRRAKTAEARAEKAEAALADHPDAARMGKLAAHLALEGNYVQRIENHTGGLGHVKWCVGPLPPESGVRLTAKTLAELVDTFPDPTTCPAGGGQSTRISELENALQHAQDQIIGQARNQGQVIVNLQARWHEEQLERAKALQRVAELEEANREKAIDEERLSAELDISHSEVVRLEGALADYPDTKLLDALSDGEVDMNCTLDWRGDGPAYLEVKLNADVDWATKQPGTIRDALRALVGMDPAQEPEPDEDEPNADGEGGKLL